MMISVLYQTITPSWICPVLAHSNNFTDRKLQMPILQSCLSRLRIKPLTYPIDLLSTPTQELFQAYHRINKLPLKESTLTITPPITLQYVKCLWLLFLPFMFYLSKFPHMFQFPNLPFKFYLPDYLFRFNFVLNPIYVLFA